ncbi:MAG: hypothetical protein ACJ75J_00365 [Cytophagaceae bacterium]|jgi:hypothetical protein
MIIILLVLCLVFLLGGSVFLIKEENLLGGIVLGLGIVCLAIIAFLFFIFAWH